MHITVDTRRDTARLQGLFLADMGLQFGCNTAPALFITRLLRSLIDSLSQLKLHSIPISWFVVHLRISFLVTMISCYLQASGQP